MPMNRDLYPDDWEEIAFAVKSEVGWICEGCGKQCRKPREPFDTHRRTLTVSHKDHNPMNCERSNLQALCAPCHLRFDKDQHAKTRKQNRNRPVIRSDGKRYESINAAALDVIGDQTNISLVCRGKRKTAYGYGWRYAENVAER